jgi:hypothetical protein
MSSTNNTPVANVVVATKAPKKPSLPAKYSKFLSFSFWFTSRLEPEVRDALYQQFKLFSSIEEQSEFFQTYLNEASASNKIMRKTIANHNKPVKTRATKARKPSKPVAAETDDLIATLIADANGEPTVAPVDKPKKTLKPKTTDNNDEKPKKTKKTKPVAESVAEPVTEPVTEPLAEPVAKKTAKSKTEKPKAEKPKAEKPKAEKPKAEKAEKPKAEKAEKPKKTKKDKTEPVVSELVPEPVATEDDGCIQARTVKMKDGSQYLMDSENNLYDLNSHDQVGTYNPDSDSVMLA